MPLPVGPQRPGRCRGADGSDDRAGPAHPGPSPTFPVAGVRPACPAGAITTQFAVAGGQPGRDADIDQRPAATRRAMRPVLGQAFFGDVELSQGDLDPRHQRAVQFLARRNRVDAGRCRRRGRAPPNTSRRNRCGCRRPSSRAAPGSARRRLMRITGAPSRVSSRPRDLVDVLHQPGRGRLRFPPPPRLQQRCRSARHVRCRAAHRTPPTRDPLQPHLASTGSSTSLDGPSRRGRTHHQHRPFFGLAQDQALGLGPGV